MSDGEESQSAWIVFVTDESTVKVALGYGSVTLSLIFSNTTTVNKTTSTHYDVCTIRYNVSVRCRKRRLLAHGSNGPTQQHACNSTTKTSDGDEESNRTKTGISRCFIEVTRKQVY